jgi:hypothetical protein
VSGYNRRRDDPDALVAEIRKLQGRISLLERTLTSQRYAKIVWSQTGATLGNGQSIITGNYYNITSQGTYARAYVNGIRALRDGLFGVAVWAPWAGASNVGNSRAITYAINGVGQSSWQSIPPGSNDYTEMSDTVMLSENDLVQAVVYQDSGGNLTLTTWPHWLKVWWIPG